MRCFHTSSFLCFLLVVEAGLGIRTLHGNVRMPAIFGDHMVLQQEQDVPVWGWAEPGEAVTVSMREQKEQTTASANGHWQVKFKPLPSGSVPVTLTVAGKNALTFTDVLVGDVWVCSGQSNMYIPLEQVDHGKEEVAKANQPQLRLFLVTQDTALTPRSDLVGRWMVCTPETVKGFSGLGYFFGRELLTSLHRPVGLIGTYQGATQAQVWAPLSELEKEPILAPYVADYQRAADCYPGGDAEFTKKISNYKLVHQQWLEKIQNDVAYQTSMKSWAAAAQAAKALNQPQPPVPPTPTPEPQRPQSSDAGTSCLLYNAMVAPLIPYAIKGVIWYQGENDTPWPSHYPGIFGGLIKGWRDQWGQGDFPFLYVQLANFQKRTGVASLPNDGWPLLREAQSQTLALPATGMIVTIDIGTVSNIHPPDKQDMGLRLALAAKHVAYKQDVVYSGPVYDSMKIEVGAIRLSFSQIGGGLVIGKAPWVDPEVGPAARKGLKGFVIKGDSGDWAWADAKIDGNTVVVSSPKVPSPKQVRYAWANNPECNLYNKEGLPASPFRTDTEP